MTDTHFPWPNGCQGTLSLTFDDGMPSHVSTAAPRLEEAGLRGTFYLCPQDDFEAQLAPFRALANAGHELGNHTVRHVCRRGLSDSSPALALEDLTLADLEAEIALASQRLRVLAPAQRDISFAYPCYQDAVGEGATRQSYVPLVARHCVAGRSWGRPLWANNPRSCDLSLLAAWPAERMDAPSLIGLAEMAVSRGLWGIFVFHGVSQGHLPVSEMDLVALCAWLSRQQARIWTAPVATVARWVVERRQ
jgi:peptidoglycan-N-acetylglucosamine deacetylase